MASVGGLIFRLAVACLPLLAVVLLCLMMFSGWVRSPKIVPDLSAQAVLMPSAQAASLGNDTHEAGKNRSKKPVSAEFERLNITHATIRVPD
ncbi:hypothetical protein [Vampirovibrio sp.]|uniref:hypothetical protein n=1 Tax=Vampirovibrio sp. TaxID=2717857 RepID=UPI00359421B4